MKYFLNSMKAVLGGIIAGLGALNIAITDGNVTGGEWINIALAFIVGTGIVYAVPNKSLDDSK